MNSHLNVFKSYTREDRVYQLENDLTRAFAISLQEDSLFLHEIIKLILHNYTSVDYYNTYFEDIENPTEINIDIQKNASTITGFEHLFAISLSEFEMTNEHFWQQSYQVEYDPICDLVVNVNNVSIIMEAKRNNVDCSAQLYNQAFNILKKNGNAEDELKAIITPVDLNWRKLISIAVKVLSFEIATGNKNRFLDDFVDLVRIHNPNWLPEPAIVSLKADNTNGIFNRMISALKSLGLEKNYSLLNGDRIGFSIQKAWANDLFFWIEENGDLVFAIYPGNTKGQGYSLFRPDYRPDFTKEIIVNGCTYPIDLSLHIKFSGQSYITGLWLKESEVNSQLYSYENFIKNTGRKKRTDGWAQIENLLNENIDANIDWKKKCDWDNKIINTNRSQFDISFGYQLELRLPFDLLKSLDTSKEDLSPLKNLLDQVYQFFNTYFD